MSAKESTTAPRLQITDRRLWPMEALAFDNRMAGYGESRHLSGLPATHAIGIYWNGAPVPARSGGGDGRTFERASSEPGHIGS
jgi:hypothetical protein